MTTTSPQLYENALFIGGTFRPASAGRTLERHNPATGELVGHFASATEADALAAIASARKAFDKGDWSRVDGAERATVMLKIADGLIEQLEHLAWLESVTTGTPLNDCRSFVRSAAETFRYFAGLARDIAGHAQTFGENRAGFTLKEPMGVVSLILPWNFPLGEAAWKVCPALAAGCAVVVKPDSKTPATALALAEILQQAGVPDGIYNVVVGEPAEVGSALTGHPDIDAISFTGSTGSGRVVMRSAADTVKPLHLELGGKSPLLIFADANLDAAAKDAAFGAFWHNGQVCTAASRLLVDKRIVGDFLERLTHHANAMTVGQPDDANTTLGSVISKQHLTRITDYIQRGLSEGATLHMGGEALTDGDFAKGAFIAPTVFVNARNDMVIAREEIFGPVTIVLPFDDENDALTIANDTTYGLGAGVWTKDVDRAFRVARRLEAGSVWVNGYGSERLEMPWGGYKQSGFGRELGRQGLDEYTRTKSLHLQIQSL